MSVMYNPESSCFTMVANDLITNKNISHGAFRVACYLRSKPNEWNINNKDIQNQLGINQNHTLAKYWKELLSAGVIHRRKCKSEAGRFSGGYDYVIGRKPEGWDDHVVDNPHCGKDKMCKTHTHSNTDLSNTDHSNISNSKESNTSCVTSAKADGEKTKKSPHKEKKESTSRLYQHQIDADEYPYASNVMKLLNETLAKHESKGMVHRFAMDKRRHELTVNPSHLSDIEDNLSELGAYADDGDEYDYVFNKLIRLYNSRVIKSKTKLVNLAFLAGVNMPAGKDEFMDSEGYARWVNEFVLDGEE